MPMQNRTFLICVYSQTLDESSIGETNLIVASLKSELARLNQIEYKICFGKLWDQNLFGAIPPPHTHFCTQHALLMHPV